MKNLILLMAVLIPGVALAQEAAESNADESWRALVWVKDGNGELIEKVRATPQFALDAIQAEEPWGGDAAMKVLGQFGGPRSAAELDALADALGRLILESTSHRVATVSLNALADAARESFSSVGIPYARGLNVLIGVYEAMDGTEAVSTYGVLVRIRHAGARGKDYVRNLFASLERPEKPCWMGRGLIHSGSPPPPPKEEHCPYETQWCEVGEVLGEYDLVYPICNRHKVKDEDGIWWTIMH